MTFTRRLLIACSGLLLCGGIACAESEGVSRVVGDGGRGDGGAATTGGTENNGGVVANGGVIANGGVVANGGATTSSTGGRTTTASSGVSALGGAGSTAAGGATSSQGGQSAASGSRLFLDDFEDGDFTAPPQMNWILADTNGTWAVATQNGSNALTVTGSSKTVAVSGDVAWTDQRVSSKVSITSGTSTVVSLMGRWSAPKNYVVVEYRVGSASSPKGDLKLRQNVDGDTSDICRFRPASALSNEVHEIGFSVKGGVGSSLTLFFDGQPVSADVPCVLGSDAPLMGGVAVGVQSGSATFDDVSVTVP